MSVICESEDMRQIEWRGACGPKSFCAMEIPLRVEGDW